MDSGTYDRRVERDNKVWQLVDGQGVLTSSKNDYLDLVIVKEAPSISRYYYKGNFEGGASAVPTCWTSDAGRGPDISAKDKQHSNCALCKQNIRGSGNNNSKACRLFTRVAVGFICDKEEAQGIFQLQLPSTSLFGAAPDKKGNPNRLPYIAYKKHLSLNGYSPEKMITRIAQDESVPYKKLLFEAVGFIPENFTQLVEDLTDSVDAEAAVKTDFTAVEDDNPFKPL
jgi:hypothetical protein|tara:strand:+ start:1561 stop:2241 length:681 start_codon:yes stop_codon:yes gene_type:complete